MKELKATDLRVGNYVEYKSDAVKMLTISGIYINIKRIGGTHRVQTIVTDYLNIKPIELTEEWFLKFGFKSYDTPLGKLFEFRTDRYTWIIDIFGNLHLDYSEYENIAKIQYVHELQNIYFALTGQELTIKN